MQVAVLAASIEASAGEVNAARALFLRAYQLNKADKQLYMQWPRMEGAVGNTERARLLFQYGLSLYPSNIKILNLYACFEAAQVCMPGTARLPCPRTPRLGTFNCVLLSTYVLLACSLRYYGTGRSYARPRPHPQLTV